MTDVKTCSCCGAPIEGDATVTLCLACFRNTVATRDGGTLMCAIHAKRIDPTSVTR